MKDLVVVHKKRKKRPPPPPPQPFEILNLSDQTWQTRSAVPLNLPIFEPLPGVVEFDDYEEFGEYEKIIHFRNNDFVARRIKVEQPNSPHFQIHGLQAKVAPGMQAKYVVKFFPSRVEDYQCELVCVTEREKFKVQVKALGLVPRLDLPKFVDFGIHAVKGCKIKPVLATNIGRTPQTPFLLSVRGDDFHVVEEGHGVCETLCTFKIAFEPKRIGSHEGELKVDLGNGYVQRIGLVGIAQAEDISLSTDSLRLDSTYVSLSSQSRFVLRNRAQLPVSYKWKQFRNVQREEEERSRLLNDLARMQELEEEQESVSLDDKYDLLRIAVEKDEMLFSDANFQLTPSSGKVMAIDDQFMDVVFRPETAADYSCTAYLDVVGREERLAVKMGGKGVGPTASLSREVLDVGDIFVTSRHAYSLTLRNKGDIVANWNLKDDNRFVHFEPSSGSLLVGEAVEITVSVVGDVLGEFQESACIDLAGSPQVLTYYVKGRVIGPTFHFNTERLDFGLCSHSVDHERTVVFTNSSDIPIQFSMRIPNDARGEFEIHPTGETRLEAMTTQTITVTFKPTAIKVYDGQYCLVVDVQGIGESLLSLPITAECSVPPINILSVDENIATTEIDFGNCFLGHPYERQIVLSNPHESLSVRFDIDLQEPRTAVVADFVFSPTSGIIPPASKVIVTTTLRCKKLGLLRLPVITTILGSSQPPLQTTIAATATGPKLCIEPEELCWGKAECLVDTPRTITIRNDSLISAPFKMFFKNARSKFRVDVREDVLLPQQQRELDIVACLDDTTVHKDQLHIVVAEGENHMIPLSAKGIGTTMSSSHDLEVVDFGYQLTSTCVERKVTLENKGRRSQTLKWINQSLQLVAATDKEDTAMPTFAVIPEEVELRPRTAAVFTFRGCSSVQGIIEEQLICETRIHKEKSWRQVFNTTLRADFRQPSLEFSQDSLDFEYRWHSTSEAMQTQSKQLSLKNNCVLPLNFQLRCSSPFCVDQHQHSLEPDESVTVNVEFDPWYKGDRVSRREDLKLVVAYNSHPHKDSICLVGDVHFPNLTFDTSHINFGCVLNDTSLTQKLRVTNTSNVEAAFRWAFLDDADMTTAPNNVFDILPIRSTLQPDEYEDVDVVFYGHANHRFKATCLCEVEGGPEYSLHLVGEASTVGFKIDKEELEFGRVMYTKTEDREFSIFNTGKVAFPFSIDASSVVEVHPSSGNVAANDKQTVIVRLKPNLPVVVSETLKIDLAHFEPIEMPIKGVGVYAHVGVSLPHDEASTQIPASLGGSTWAKCLVKTRAIMGGKPKASQVEKEARRLVFLEQLKNPSSSSSRASSRYCCDFGNVVKGMSKKKTFKITNTGTGALSWTFDKKLMANTGFSIEPEKVVKLPEGSSVQYTVNFVARNTLPTGRRELPLVVDVKNGPLTTIALCANITTPDISLSADTLDFGTVWTGCGKRMYLQIHNVSPVVAEWDVKKLLASEKNTSEQRFRVSPRSGVLQPGKKINVEVEFAPIDDRIVVFKLPLRVAQSAKTHAVNLRGVGAVAKLNFEPNVIDLGPMLPSEDRGTTVTMTNASDRPLQVYSVDFDKVHLDEEAFLMQYPFKEDVLRLSVETPLHEFIDDARKLSTSAVDAEDAEDIAVVQVAHHQCSFMNEADVYGGPADKGSLRARGLAKDVAFASPLFSGATQVASYIANVHGYAMARPKAIIRTLATVNSRLGSRARCFLGLQTEAEIAQDAVNAVHRDEAIKAITSAKAQLKGLEAKAKKKKGPKPETVVAESLDDVNAIVDEFGFVREHELLAEAIAWRKNRADASRGLVLDLCEDDDIKMLASAATQLVLAEIDGETYALHLRALDALAEQLSDADEVTPDDVDKLSLLNHPPIATAEGAIDHELLATTRERIRSLLSEKEGGPLRHFHNVAATLDDIVPTAQVKLFRETPEDWHDVDFDLCQEDMASIIAVVEEPIEPKPDPNYVPLPDPQTTRIVRKPARRSPPSEERKLFTICSNANDGDEDLTAPVVRWDLEAGASTSFDVKFSPQAVGSIESKLIFEVSGVPDQKFSLPCVGVAAVPTINSDPRNVFMKRVKKRPTGSKVQPLYKRFIAAENIYEFGPLLLNNTETSEENTDVFRISNNSSFADSARVYFKLQEEVGFAVEPSDMELEPGETKDIRVSAFPPTTGRHECTLLAHVEKNPEPYAFKIACEGVEPVLALKGPWGNDEERLVNFDRLLLGRSEDRTIEIINESLCNVDWRLDRGNFNTLSVDRAEGKLGIHESTFVTVSFAATEPVAVEPTLAVEYAAADSGLLCDANADARKKVRCIEVKFKAEAYLIKAIVLDEDDAKRDEKKAASKVDAVEKSKPGTLNFGHLRVGEIKELGFVLRNKGKYQFSFAFKMKRGKNADVFSIHPAEGVIEADGSVRVAVTCCSLREFKVSNDKDISCTIFEPATGEAVERFPVTVAASAVFPKYRTQPHRGITFGTVKYTDSTKERKFELRNEGIFSFAFAVAEIAEDGAVDDFDVKRKDVALTRVLSATPRALLSSLDDEKLRLLAADAGLLPPSDDQREVRNFYLAAQPVEDSDPPSSDQVSRGPYVVSPGGGVVEPGQSLQISVKFTPAGCSTHPAKLLLYVAGCVGNDGFSTYELFAESQSPGINTTDWYQIFEEQAIVGSLAEARTDVEKEKPVLPALGSIFAIRENLFSFGTTLLSDDASRKSTERFKVTNPNKVPAVVDFSFKGSTTSQAFTVQPTSWEVPPFEHRYVSVYFHPPEMKEYRTTFEASVQNENSTEALSFDLAGRGTLPTVSISGTADFGRVHVGRTRTKQIQLRNDGELAATAVVTLEGDTSESFACSHAGSSVVLAPGESTEIDISFESRLQEEDGLRREGTIVLKVVDNPYEKTVIKCSGVAFENDVSVDELDGEDLRFGEINLAEQRNKTVEFELRNLRRETIRFEWQDHPIVTFKPRLGHLPPSARTPIIATFLGGDDPSDIDEWLSLETVAIRLAEEQKIPWDSNTFTERKSALGEDSGALDPARGEEPEHVRTSELRSQQLKCTGVADTPRFACDASKLLFTTTPMYQTAIQTFELANNSMIGLPYSWTFEKEKDIERATQNNTPNPFVVEPATGTLAANTSIKFTVRFTPLESEDYEFAMTCQMPAPAEIPLSVSLSGRSTRPTCHFDGLDDTKSSSQYFLTRPSNALNEYGRCDAITATSLRVVELSSRGLRLQNTKLFNAVNPSSDAFDFAWVPCGQRSPAWRCLTPKGTILPGGKSEMRFEFTATQSGVAEAFYRFTINDLKYDELFLFAGTVVEPRIKLDRARVELGAVLVGGMHSETLHVINDENLPFEFYFDNPVIDVPLPSQRTTTLVQKNRRNKPTLEISPRSGVVPPNGRAAVDLLFRPAEEGSWNTNVSCTVRKKKMKLSLNVKGEGYGVHARVLLPDETGHEVELEHGSRNSIDFGTIRQDHEITKTVKLVNSGKFNFDFLTVQATENSMLTVRGGHGTVCKTGKASTISLIFRPVAPIVLDGCSMTLVIAGKFKFFFDLTGRGLATAAKFSFKEYNFGPCFLWQPPQLESTVARESAKLRISNRDKESSLAVDCAMQFPTDHAMRVECGPTNLAPGEHKDVVVHFSPREAREYAIPIPFVIDGVTTVNVVFKGRGVPARLELAQASQARIAFGKVKVGSNAVRTFQLVNRSPKAMDFSLLYDASYAEVSIAPLSATKLPARATQNVQVKFSPTKRSRQPFEMPIRLEYAGGQVRELCTVSGRATGTELALSSDALSFGNVCVGSRRTRKLKLENSGDTSTSFSWRVETPLFSILPKEGYVRAGCEVTFDVSFQPTEVDDDVRVDGILLDVDNGRKLSLSCAGACIPQPEESKQTLTFESLARKMTSRTVVIRNPSSKPWFLAPTLTHHTLEDGSDKRLEHFRAPAELVVQAQSQADLEVTYIPLTTTSTEQQQQKHLAELFVATPDGSAQSFRLEGTAGPPELIVNEPLQTPAKQSMSISLPVTNWLRQATQMFNVSFHITEGDAESIVLEGTPTLELSPGATEQYRLRFYSFQTGTVKAVVTLKAADSGEYVAHALHVDVTRPGVSGTLSLASAVRQSTRKLITIDNPLPSNREITFADDWWSCDNPYVRLTKVGAMRGNPDGVFEVEYRPLVATEDDTKTPSQLVFKIDQLGEYRYSLNLSASPAQHHPKQSFDASLGNTQSQAIVFKIYPSGPAPCSFDCSVEDEQPSRCFALSEKKTKEVKVDSWDGIDITVDVVFEPDSLGTHGGVLLLDGGPAGIYRCELVGSCSRPSPRGPIDVKPGGKSEILFRNVFAHNTDFSFTVDSPEPFGVSVPRASIAPRSDYTIAVTCTAGDENEGATGKLVVDATTKDGTFSWVYYLRRIRQ